MKKVEIVVDRKIILGVAAGFVTDEPSGLRPERGTTAKVAIKEQDRGK
jgi:hypothetical protein